MNYLDKKTPNNNNNTSKDQKMGQNNAHELTLYSSVESKFIYHTELPVPFTLVIY